MSDDSGRLIAGLSISAPADRLQDAWLDDLMTTARQISVALGYTENSAAMNHER
jgi:DNA-binding IclR family transcriptional regulator